MKTEFLLSIKPLGKRFFKNVFKSKEKESCFILFIKTNFSSKFFSLIKLFLIAILNLKNIYKCF